MVRRLRYVRASLVWLSCGEMWSDEVRRLSLVVISGGELSHVAVINFLEG